MCGWTVSLLIILTDVSSCNSPGRYFANAWTILRWERQGNRWFHTHNIHVRAPSFLIYFTIRPDRPCIICNPTASCRRLIKALWPVMTCAIAYLTTMGIVEWSRRDLNAAQMGLSAFPSSAPHCIPNQESQGGNRHWLAAMMRENASMKGANSDFAYVLAQLFRMRVEVTRYGISARELLATTTILVNIFSNLYCTHLKSSICIKHMKIHTVCIHDNCSHETL